MPDPLKSCDERIGVELTTDFLGEDRHEFVAKLAFKLWEDRGRPFGSPEVDWYAAERMVFSELLASGLIPPSAGSSQKIAEQIYH